ncbi:MAG: tetratricopeptide repeat protein [Spirochaetales bacterium]|nr:MAG: tetratricopeptide repeat protein [Spirochaetales bacterium]
MGDLLPLVIVIIFLSLVILVGGMVLTTSSNPGKKGRRLKAKDNVQILKEANRRLAQNPKDGEALMALGDVYFLEQAWDKAFKVYETLMDVAAGNPDLDEFTVNQRYGMTALKLNRMDEAYKGLVVANAVKQDDFETCFNLGYLEFQRRQYEKAIIYLKQAARLNPEHAFALRYLGHSLFKIKNYRDSLAILKRAVDLQPEDKESLFAMGECQFELGQLDQAIRIFAHLRTDPALGPSAALFAGTIHLNQRQFQKAVMDFEIGLRHPDIKVEVLVEIKYRLAAAYLKEQEIAKAVALLNEIQQIYPNFKDVPAQLLRYKELNSNRNLQTYLLSATSDFITLCRKITLTFFPKAKVKITDISVQKNDWADILAEVETNRWSDVVLFRLIRSTGTIGELVLRDFHARIKDLKAGKGYCVTAGIFSDEAKKFVEARLIDLMEKDQLMNLLKNIDSRQKGLLIDD